MMQPHEKTKLEVLRCMEHPLDLKLLRGTIPWSLAGTSGDRRRANLERRDTLVRRIGEAIGERYSVQLEPVDPRTGRIGLVFHSRANDARIEWRW